LHAEGKVCSLSFSDTRSPYSFRYCSAPTSIPLALLVVTFLRPPGAACYRNFVLHESLFQYENRSKVHDLASTLAVMGHEFNLQCSRGASRREVHRLAHSDYDQSLLPRTKASRSCSVDIYNLRRTKGQIAIRYSCPICEPMPRRYFCSGLCPCSLHSEDPIPAPLSLRMQRCAEGKAQHTARVRWIDDTIVPQACGREERLTLRFVLRRDSSLEGCLLVRAPRPALCTTLLLFNLNAKFRMSHC
jgi:hypothetical protein